MNLENYFISQFQNTHIGDDGALIKNCVYSKDAFFENVHFKTSWMSHYQIAHKAMMVNISDAVAMHAIPKYALLSVAMPKSITKEQMRELARGFEDAAKEYDIEIVGGDTIANIKLDITITIISQTKKPLFRSGLRHNHLLAYTGELGQSYKDLKRLMCLGRIHKNSKFANIKLRQKFVQKSFRYLSAGMDISDGLYRDMGKLSQQNRLGFRMLHSIPKVVGCSGEEYEMLVSFDRRERKTVLRRSRQTRTPLHIFAKASRRKYVGRCKANHF